MRPKFLVYTLYASLFFSLSWVGTTAMCNTKDSEGGSVQPTANASGTPQTTSNNKQPMAEALATKGVLGKVPETTADTEHPQDSPRFYLQKITLQGAKFLGRRARKRLLKPYLHQLVDATRINQLAQAIQAYYIAQGYPTTQVKVRVGQSLQAGELKIDIQLGFIEDIILNGHTARDKGKVATAFLWFKGCPLYLPYLDRGIDQLNAVSSSWATLRILPGLREGGSVILVDQTVSKPVRINIGSDNLGKEEAGKWRWKYHVDINNLLSINDSITAHYDINYAKVLQGKKLRNRHWMLKYSFPIGPLNVSTSHNINTAITPYGTKDYQKLYTQYSYVQAYEVKIPIYKYGGYRGTILVALNHSTASNFIQDVVIHTQSKPATQGKLETNHTGLLYQGFYTLTLSYEQGLTWFGAEVDKDKPEPGVRVSDMPKHQFKKMHVHGLWNRPFTFFKSSFHYQLDCTGQYSRDEIIGDQQLSLTGSEQVRGFTESYTGNKGVYCKQEISWKHLLPFTRWLYPLNVSTGVDIGYLPKRSNTDPKNAQLSLMLASLILGFQYHVGWLGIDCTYAQPLYRNKEWGKLHEKGKIYISCNLHVHELIVLFGGR